MWFYNRFKVLIRLQIINSCTKNMYIPLCCRICSKTLFLHRFHIHFQKKLCGESGKSKKTYSFLMDNLNIKNGVERIEKENVSSLSLPWKMKITTWTFWNSIILQRCAQNTLRLPVKCSMFILF